AIGTDHHEVGDGAGAEVDRSTDDIVKGDVVVWHAQPPDGFAAFCFIGGDLFFGQVTVVAVVAKFLIASGSFVAGFGFFSGRIGRVDEAGLFEFGDDVLVDLTALGLTVGLMRAADFYTFVPVNAHPFHGIKKLLVRLFRVAFLVGVFNAEDHFAAGVAGPAPVEQGGAD